MSLDLQVKSNPVLRWLQKTLTDLSPFAGYQYIDVVFTHADTDLDIPHRLMPLKPDSIDYLLVRSDRPCVIYNDNSSTRRPWGTGYVTLRCSVAAQARVLLLHRKEV